MSRIRYLTFGIAALAALFFSAFAAMPAYADEGTPPPPASEEGAPPVDSGAGEEPAPPADSPDEGESVPPVEESAPSVEEVLAALPEETPVVVLDEQGQALPLASEQAAEVIENHDPMWCPAGVTPGGAGCTAVTNSFATMLTNLTGMYGATGPAKAGVIWIAASYDSSVDDPAATDFTLDGSVLTTMNDFALTINGGWSGAGTTLMDTDPSEFNVPFSIIGWNAPITINNLLVTGAGGMNYALQVQTTGNITVNNTDVITNTSQFGGAYLGNDTGTGNIVVNNSSFSSNSGGSAYGLEIVSSGTVTLKDVDASANTQVGAYIDNDLPPTPKAVTLNGANTFNGNGEDGLLIYSRGAVTLNNITAVGNTQTGVYVDNCQFNFVSGLCALTGTAGAGVTLKGANLFSGNGFEGLRVWSGGAISVSNITAYANGTNPARQSSTLVDPNGIPASGDEYYTYDAEGKGVFLHNYGASSAKPVTISGNNSFNNNGSSGLFVYTKGLVTANNITANFNDCNIAFDFDDTYCAGAYIYSESGVKQTGYGTFHDNTREGLFIYNNVKGAVALNNLTAESNGFGAASDGVSIYNVSAVSVTGTNIFKGNSANGLYVDTSGTITLSNATASSNSANGIFLFNAYSTKGAVTLLGQTITESNSATGVHIVSYGAVTTSGIFSRYNSGNGAYIDNCDDFGGACNAPAALPVTMNGDNVLLFNTNANLFVKSRGVISVNNLTAQSSSTSFGAYLDNRYSNSVSGVNLKGYARSLSNNGDNIVIYSNGAVSAANVTASYSQTNYGMFIMNQTAAMPGVTLSGVNQFNDNARTGLYVLSYGAVSASNLTANGNGNPLFGQGAYINNAGGTAPKPITISGLNAFNSNFQTGLTVLSLGAITVHNVTAGFNSNGGDGAILYNQYGVYIQPITIVGYGVFENNGSSGLTVQSNGNVTMANLTAKNNSVDGVYIGTSNSGATSVAANVTLTGYNTFLSNTTGTGLYVANDGNITVSNVTANSNGYYGARLDNATSAGVGEVKTITVNGLNNFYWNAGLAGLGVFSSGGANLTRINSGMNFDSSGVTTHGLYANVAGTLTLTCGKFYGNEGAGYNLNAAVIKLMGFLSTSNGAVDSAAAGMVTQTKACALP